jgi:hypothetical protein
MAILPKIFGDLATKVSGFGFSFSGVSSIFTFILVTTLLHDLGYLFFYVVGGTLSFISLILLLFVFEEK